jgi:hypothetical protein
MLRRSSLIMCLILIMVASVLSENIYAAEQNAIDNGNVSLGAGIYVQKFSETDSLRKATGLFGSFDEIKFITGFSLNAELLLNKTFSFQSPIGLATGYRYQYGTGGYNYSSSIDGNLERRVSITNHIVYVSAALPLDSDKYFLLGVSAGAGLSKYTYSEKYSNPIYSDIEKSANGQVFPVGGFFDWGADGFGGRLGADYIISKYKKIYSLQPKGNGMQYYLTIRYVI